MSAVLRGHIKAQTHTRERERGNGIHCTVNIKLNRYIKKQVNESANSENETRHIKIDAFLLIFCFEPLTDVTLTNHNFSNRNLLSFSIFLLV